MSARRRRGPRGPARCRDCRAPIAFYGSPFTGARRAFDARPVDPRQLGQLPQPAFPVENGSRAWRLEQLVEELMVRHGVGHAEALDEAHAMPWHTLHSCPTPATLEETP